MICCCYANSGGNQGAGCQFFLPFSSKCLKKTFPHQFHTPAVHANVAGQKNLSRTRPDGPSQPIKAAQLLPRATRVVG